MLLLWLAFGAGVSGERSANRTLVARARRPPSGPRQAWQNKLEDVTLAISNAQQEHLHLLRRYEYFFDQVFYLLRPSSSMSQEACEKHGLRCFFSSEESRLVSYSAFLRTAPTSTGGVLFAEAQFWIQPIPLAGGELDLGRPWLLVAGLSLKKYRRVYSGPSCGTVDRLRRDPDMPIVIPTQEPPFSKMCVGPTEFFFVPRVRWKSFSDLADGPFKKLQPEIAVHTILRDDAQYVDCWGCSNGVARDPYVIEKFFCGHRIAFEHEHVRLAWRGILDNQHFILVNSFQIEKRNDTNLQRAIQSLDETYEPKSPVQSRYTMRHTPDMDITTTTCCDLHPDRQNACSCVLLSPPSNLVPHPTPAIKRIGLPGDIETKKNNVTVNDEGDERHQCSSSIGPLKSPTRRSSSLVRSRSYYRIPRSISGHSLNVHA